jgi:uncharacterized membrane protein YuzA (DUF378 family)
MSTISISTNLKKFALDVIIFIAFLTMTDPHVTGVSLHEWVSIALAGAFVVHLLLNWDWLIATTRRFFGKLTPLTRLNYFINGILGISMIVVIFSGLLISRVAAPAIGIYPQFGFYWRSIHDISTTITVIALGVHLALHWTWIVGMVKSYILRPLGIGKNQPTHEPITEANS